MKKSFLFFILLVSSIVKLAAQDSIPCLVIEKFYHGKVSSETKPVCIGTGEKILVRTKLNPHPQTGILHAVNDSSLTMDSTTILLRDLTEIGWYKPHKSHGPVIFIIGGGLMVAGAAMVGAGIIQVRDHTGEGGVINGGILGFYGGAIFIVGAAVTMTGLVAIGQGDLHKKQLSEIYKVRAGKMMKVVVQEKGKRLKENKK